MYWDNSRRQHDSRFVLLFLTYSRSHRYRDFFIRLRDQVSRSCGGMRSPFCTFPPAHFHAHLSASTVDSAPTRTYVFHCAYGPHARQHIFPAAMTNSDYHVISPLRILRTRRRRMEHLRPSNFYIEQQSCLTHLELERFKTKMQSS